MQRENAHEWAEVTKQNPCPLCGKPDWCSVSANSEAVLCRRTDSSPSGWKQIKTSKDDYPIYALINSSSDYVQNRPQRGRVTRPKPKTTIPIDQNIQFAELPQPVTPVERKEKGDRTEIIYPYSSHYWVLRVEKKDPSKPKGYTKAHYPRYLDSEGVDRPGKTEYGMYLYRWSEVYSYAKGKWILGVEGEPCVEAARYLLNIVAVTWQGASWTHKELTEWMLFCKDHGVSGMAYLPDNDAPGLKKAEAVEKAANEAEFPLICLSPTALWTECPDKGDIADWVKWGMGKGFSKQDFIERLEREIHQAVDRRKSGELDNADVVTEKIPPADRIAREIAEEYLNKLAFNNEIGQWMRYGGDCGGVWSVETDEYIESEIVNIIHGKGIVDYRSHNYITNIVKTLRCLLIARKWQERSPKQMLPFKNGVLEVATGELLPHSPLYRITWQLPREYKNQAGDWSKIAAFLEHLANGNERIKDLLVCYCAAVLRGRSDLQKFIHLIGLGGTGKSSFSRLVTSLIGEDNVHTSNLEDWCGNRFEPSNAYRKRLVVFADADKQNGKLGKFLSLIGEDWIRAEYKGKKAFNYRFDGMVMVSSNEPIFGGDSASRVKRRVITVPCNNAVPASKRRNLEAEFEPELSAFTNYVLSIPDDHVTSVMLGLEEIPECTLEFWDNRTRVDSIAAWLNDWVIYDPLTTTAVGNNRNEAEIRSQAITLFGSYALYCHQTGSSAKSNKNFSPDLLELCKSVLGWQVERKITNNGKFIRGLRLRIPGLDDQIPTHERLLTQRVTEGEGR
ncbi:hypothetical protein BV372_06860 [Nostoc sp. T09]|uniref:DNA primase family protein n=1 Tax=Nostoc sp. T09 TaxID=1932621 RepID=UPI000B6F2D51|nr:DUF5906 domain-containing protein [Nostoc sp. T09]OUL36570.1 hypothetical protein BV372_06860 [Nostoc sp. T09]